MDGLNFPHPLSTLNIQASIGEFVAFATVLHSSTKQYIPYKQTELYLTFLLSLGILQKHYMVRMKKKILLKITPVWKSQNCLVFIRFPMKRLRLLLKYFFIHCTFYMIFLIIRMFPFRFFWRVVHMDLMYNLVRTRKGTRPKEPLFPWYEVFFSVFA